MTAPFSLPAEINTLIINAMIDLNYEFEARIWLWDLQAAASWHFITLPVDVADEIKFFARNRNVFGSLRVEARLGESIWQTSIFPDKSSGSFLLPLKKAVRTAEQVGVDDVIKLHIHVKYDVT